MQTPLGRRPSSLNRSWINSARWSLICDSRYKKDQINKVTAQVENEIIRLGAGTDLAQRILDELIRVASTVISYSDMGKFSLTLSIRLFTQYSQFHQASYHGWGFFIIERINLKSESPLNTTTSLIDIYIYQERPDTTPS